MMDVEHRPTTSTASIPVPIAIERHRRDIVDLCERTHARRLYLFGSGARSDFDEARSDLDFVVEFDDLPPGRYADAWFDLKEGLEALFGRPVDLLTEAGLRNPHLRARIDAERVSVYAR